MNPEEIKTQLKSGVSMAMGAEAPALRRPRPGDVVDYTLASEHDGTQVVRGAMVTQVWGEGCVNLQVFVDGFNDLQYGQLVTREEAERGIAWRTSCARGYGVGEWRFR